MKKLKQPEIFYTEQIGINAKFFGKKPAVVCGEERQSWEDFHRRTNMVANALLGLGLKKGDKVALLMQNSVAMFELIWGTIKAGGVTVPINVMLAQDSLGVDQEGVPLGIGRDPGAIAAAHHATGIGEQREHQSFTAAEGGMGLVAMKRD